MTRFCLFRKVIIAVFITMTPMAMSATDLDSLMKSAYIHLDNNRPDNALSAFLKVSSYKDSVNGSEPRWDIIANALYNAGVICSYTAIDYLNAYRYFSEALKISLEHRVKHLPPYIYLASANLHMMIDMVRESSYFQNKIVELFKLCYKEAVGIKEWNLALGAIDNVSWYVLVNDKDSECAGLARFLDLSVIPPSRWRDFSDRYVLALEATSRKDFNKAAEIIDTMVPPVREAQAERMKIDAIICKARLLRRAGATDEAAKLLAIAQKYVESQDCHDLGLFVYREMWQAAEASGDKNTAHDSYNRYLHTRDSLQSYCKLQDMSESQLDSQIGSLTEQLDKISHKSRVTNVAGIGVIILLVAALTVIVVRHNRIKKHNLSLYREAMSILSAYSDRDVSPRPVATDTDEKDDTDGLYSRILEAMANPDLICNEDFKVSRLASYIGSPTKAVSAAIRECYNGTFSQLLNEFRMKEACRRLSNTTDYGNYTIEAISLSLGIKSRTGFIASFKKATGLTPSQFQRIAKNQADGKTSAPAACLNKSRKNSDTDKAK